MTPRRGPASWFISSISAAAKRLALLVPPIRLLYEQRNQLLSREATLKARDALAERYHAIARTAATVPPFDFKIYHANIAAAEHSPIGKNVLVVGCNRGEDCKIFIDMGAANVTGLDVLDEIGRNYSHPSVRYERASAEHMPFPSDTFDFVFAYATLEHVPDVRLALQEMARVCAPRGLIYSAAAPLWNSRQGPHWGHAFDDFPWLHLRKSVKDIQIYNKLTRAQHPDAPVLSEEQIAYWLDDRYFNKRWAREYLAAGWSVVNVEVLRNELQCEPKEVLADDVFRELSAKGFSRQELLALTHIFVARRL